MKAFAAKEELEIVLSTPPFRPPRLEPERGEFRPRAQPVPFGYFQTDTRGSEACRQLPLLQATDQEAV